MPEVPADDIAVLGPRKRVCVVIKDFDAGYKHTIRLFVCVCVCVCVWCLYIYYPYLSISISISIYLSLHGQTGVGVLMLHHVQDKLARFYFTFLYLVTASWCSFMCETRSRDLISHTRTAPDTPPVIRKRWLCDTHSADTPSWNIVFL
jgi:hypothetical protein